jgi:hypothetical protein
LAVIRTKIIKQELTPSKKKPPNNWWLFINNIKVIA